MQRPTLRNPWGLTFQESHPVAPPMPPAHAARIIYTQAALQEQHRQRVARAVQQALLHHHYGR